MIAHGRIVVALALAVATVAQADSGGVPGLAELTGINIGTVAAKLAQHQATVNAMFAKRIDLIAEVERLALSGSMSVDREVAILKATGGTDLNKSFDALRAFADESAQASSRLDAAEAQARKDIGAVYKPLSLSSDQLTEVAKKLASLAKPKSDEERVQFLISYVAEVRQDVEKLKKDSDSAKDQATANTGAKSANDVPSIKQLLKEIERELKPAPASAATPR